MATADTLRYTRIPLSQGSGAIPAAGFGTLICDPLATKQTTRTALVVGFRHLGCAKRYRNNEATGDAKPAGFMAMLNIQITDAALPDILGAISAGLDDGGWVSTSYLITEIIVIPLTAWLARVFSVRRCLLVNAVRFVCFSAPRASASDLSQMIVPRAFSGLHRRRSYPNGIHHSDDQSATETIAHAAQWRAGHRLSRRPVLG